MNKNNHCSCSRKAKAAVEAGFVHIDKLPSGDKVLPKITELAKKNVSKVDIVLSNSIDMFYQEQAFFDSPNYVDKLKKIVFDGIRI